MSDEFGPLDVLVADVAFWIDHLLRDKKRKRKKRKRKLFARSKATKNTHGIIATNRRSLGPQRLRAQKSN
jgi:hypothetical protein